MTSSPPLSVPAHIYSFPNNISCKFLRKVRLNFPFYFTFIYNLWQFSLFVNYLWQQAPVCISASISQKYNTYSVQFCNTRIILEKSFIDFRSWPEPEFVNVSEAEESIPRIDSNESIPPAYVAWRAGTANIGLLYRPDRQNLWWMAFISNMV